MELYETAQGYVGIVREDKVASNGVLILNPRTEMSKHLRDSEEVLTQIAGKSLVKIIDNTSTSEHVIEFGQSITLPGGKYHVHANPFDEESITIWDFAGNLSDVLDAVRAENKRVL